MTDLMKYDPSKRPTASQALQYPYFQIGISAPIPMKIQTGRSTMQETSNQQQQQQDLSRKPQFIPQYGVVYPSKSHPPYPSQPFAQRFNPNDDESTSGVSSLASSKAPSPTTNKTGRNSSLMKNARYIPGASTKSPRKGAVMGVVGGR
jgi:hypothetical protein